MSFASSLRHRLGCTSGRTSQNRFWDHIIRDQNDFNRHVDYIHYNPVKHGFVEEPGNWPHTSFHEYLADGLYSSDWGCRPSSAFEGDFGE